MTPAEVLAAIAHRIVRPFPWSRSDAITPLQVQAPPSAPLAPDQVPPQRTVMSRTEATTTLRTALRSALGREPTTEELKMIVAQSDLETRHWAAMWNWNFGNAVARAGKPWFYIPGFTTHKFQAFPDAATGAAYFVGLLKRRFNKAWALLGSGDTLAFSQALKDQGYFEGTAENYASGLESRYAVA